MNSANRSKEDWGNRSIARSLRGHRNLVHRTTESGQHWILRFAPSDRKITKVTRSKLCRLCGLFGVSEPDHILMYVSVGLFATHSCREASYLSLQNTVASR
jgi:hypothetical protein